MPEDAKAAIDRYVDERDERRPGHDVAAVPIEDDVVLLCPEDDLTVRSTDDESVMRVDIDSEAFAMASSDDAVDLQEVR
ncbi:hypothetical protein [Halosimplex sp. J119]